ncbi:ABC transporter ATP-binding protein [Acholeplasma hippikon]|nr:ABC transporter ATP-binding protein [Acholeplasma hippikon]
MDNILEITDLSKSFGEVKAVNHISFDVRRGSLFAFLGQNGAGKSTTIKMITTLLKKDTGNILLNGKEDEAYFREKIGVVFQDNVLDGLLTVKENLMLRGAFYLKEKEKVEARYEELMAKLNLKEIENQRFKTLSGGQKRRVEIARALFSNPELLILDEPTTGLDPETRLVVWEVINKLRVEEGVTVLLTTHYMEEATNADYVVIIHKGKIVAKGSPSELKDAHSKDYFKLVPHKKAELVSYLEKEKRDFFKKSDVYYIEIKDTKDAIGLIVDLKENIRNFEVVNGTLDDVFVKIVGEQNV